MAGKAFTIPVDLGAANGTLTQMKVTLRIAAGDGIVQQFFAGSFIFDASLTNAQNLTALKNSVVAQCAANGISLTNADVAVFTAIN